LASEGGDVLQQGPPSGAQPHHETVSVGSGLPSSVSLGPPVQIRDPPSIRHPRPEAAGERGHVRDRHRRHLAHCLGPSSYLTLHHRHLVQRPPCLLISLLSPSCL